MTDSTRETAAERDRLKAEKAELVKALVEIEASGSCYCPRDADDQRLGNKCSVCVARAVLAKQESTS